MDLEIILLSEISQRQIYCLYVESKKKKDTDEIMYKIETDSQTLKKKCMVTKEERGRKKMN